MKRLADVALTTVAGAALLGALGAGTFLRRVEVAGRSMEPGLLPGDRVLVVRRPWGKALGPRVGDVVALHDPRRPARLLVKRVSMVEGRTGMVEVTGDARDASTDSRAFGPVPMSLVVGRVVYRYGPIGRSGLIDRTESGLIERTEEYDQT